MNTEDALQANLDSTPEDWQCRLVLADYLEEIDDKRAAGYRTLGLLRKWPIVYGHKWGWSNVTMAAYTNMCLPNCWWILMYRFHFDIEYYDKDTRKEAEDYATLCWLDLDTIKQQAIVDTCPYLK